jgi:hypothetical protein
MEMWRRRGKAASAGLSAALHSVYHGLYSEAAVSSVASAVALAEVGRFGEAVQYMQRAAKALYEAAKEVFDKVKVTVQRLVELFVEAVARVLAWVDEHKAYLFLMAAIAAGVVALSVALNMWGLVELEKLAHAASAPLVAGLADAGGRAAGRFGVVAERWRVDENEKQKIEEVINEVINAPLKGERSFSKLTRLENLPPPLAVLRKALARVEGEVEKDAAVVAALVLYKALINNAKAYEEWAELYKWARGLVKEREFTVKAEEVKRLREAQKRLEEVAEQVRRELNAVLALYALHSRDLYEKLKPHLEVDVEKAEGLAKAGRRRLSDYSDTGMGTRAYAALLSVARGGLYGHVAMLLIGEGALADVVLLTPRSAYEKVWDIAKGRGEAVDPSRSRVGAPGWEDRAAPALLRYLLGRAASEDFVFRRVGEGFEVFRTYGGVEARVDVLKIGKTAARSKAAEEVLRRFVEEAKEMAPDLSGIRKIWQTLEWFATDVSFNKGQIEAGTAHTWQAAWYVALLGEPESTSGTANVTGEGHRLNVTMRWPRESLDRIIAEEGKELKPLLGPVSKQGGVPREAEGPAVKSWREIVDAIDWSWVLKKVEELVDRLKPWIGPEKISDVEREGLVRRMLGELELLANFAEARRGMDDGRWKEVRAVRLAEAVEALSGGRIKGDHAETLARLIISYAESRKREIKERIENLAEKVGVSSKEVWEIVEFVLSDMYCLVRDCARDEVVRKFVAPALELVMLDKALKNEFSREEALLIFGEMYATAVAGDGHVGRRSVVLAVGGELGGGAALLRLTTLHLLNELLPDGLKFNVRVYVESGIYRITSAGENAAGLMRFLAVSAPSAGGGYLSPKFDEFVEEARVDVRPGNVKLTDGGNVAADLIISVGGAAVKYNVYLRKDEVELQFASTDRSRAELAARLLKLVGVNAEVKKVGNGDVWRVTATTDVLAAGRKELRDALAEIVKEAVERGGVNKKKAEGWLEKLEKGRVLMEGWPKYHVRLAKSALEVRFGSTSSGNIEREKQRLENMGLKEGKHFTVKMPKGGKAGYVSILKEGLAYAAWLSVHGEDKQQRELAAKFVELILQRAKEAGEDVRKKAEEIVKEGRSWGSLTLKGFEKEDEVEGRTYVVKVIDGGAEFDVGRSGRKLLRIRITAEVDGVRREYAITFGRYGRNNVAKGFAYVSEEADAERFAAVIKALTGRKPRIRRIKDGTIMIECYEGHLEGFRRFAELAKAIEKWLEETGR